MSESLHVIPRLPARGLWSVFAVCCALAAAAYALALAPAALAEACPNEAYRVGPSASLPDCRAYEMVTPPYKEGYPVDVGPLAADGTSLVAESFGTFAGVEANNEIDDNGNLYSSASSYYELARGSSGWTVAPISLPQSRFPVALPADYTADLASSLWLASTPTQALHAVNPYKILGDFYLREPGGATVDVGPLYPPSAEPELFGQDDFFYDGASGDLSHILFTMYNNHWPGDPTPNGVGNEHPSLYEYSGTGNTAPSLVGVSGGQASTSLISECGTELGPPSPSSERSRNSVSTTAATVFFTALACGSSPTVDELYARVDGGEADAHTVAISEPSPADCAACDTALAVRAGATFQGASPDGSQVFFTTRQPLLGADTSNNLYEYDFEDPEGQRLTRVSAGDGTLPVPEAGVQSVLAISNDATHVYFTATGALTSAPNTLGQTARAGAGSLYLFERDARYPAGRIAFVANLSGAGLQADSLSSNGRFLAFVTSAHVTPDDTSDGGQAFEYDAETGALVRASIGQEGYDSNGNNSAPTLAQRSSVARGGANANSPVDAATGLSVADDGAVFFTSNASLVPQAVSGAANVYEYENGNVYLISDGHDTYGASLLFVDPSGTDVFFETHDQLVAQDGDTQADVYDARADGGFPPPAAPPTCEGDACQGQLSASPVLLAPGSESQAGGGNLSPAAPQPAPATTSKAKKTKGKPKARSKTKRRRGKQAAKRVARGDAKRGGRS